MEFDQGSLNARLYDRVCCAISSDGFTHLHAALLYAHIYDATAAGIIIIIYTIIILLSLSLPTTMTTNTQKTRYILLYSLRYYTISY